MWLINDKKNSATKCEKVSNVSFRIYQEHYVAPYEVKIEIKFDNYIFSVTFELKELIKKDVIVEKINIETLILFAENLLEEKYVEKDKICEMLLEYLKKGYTLKGAEK